MGTSSGRSPLTGAWTTVLRTAWEQGAKTCLLSLSGPPIQGCVHQSEVQWDGVPELTPQKPSAP